MKSILARVRAVLLLGLLWAFVWAPIGVLIGMIVDADGTMDEPWIAVGAYPGMLSGVLFAAVRGARAHSLLRVAATGAVCGMLVSLIPWILGTPSLENPTWLLPIVVAGITAMSTVSAVVTEYVRMQRRRVAS